MRSASDGMSKKNSAGIAMLDVLISMGIVSVVLLSLLSYQIAMIKEIGQAGLKTIATMQLLNFSEMLLIAKNQSRREDALNAWNNDNANLLPQGSGDYDQTDDHVCQITINWFFGKANTESMVVYC